MDTLEFIRESERTLSEEFYATKNSAQKQLHGAIGIVTEVGEIMEAITKERVDKINLSEEIADLYWYLAIFQREHSFVAKTVEKDSQKIDQDKLIVTVSKLFILSSELLDIYKKFCFYGKTYDVDAIKNLCDEISLCCVSLTTFTEIPLEVSLARNIEKLRARYPEKFNSSNAINRDLKKERKILEGKKDK